MSKRALYAGSFDPITLGHIDIIGQASEIFDIVHVAVGQNPKKTGLFTVEERRHLIKKSLIARLPQLVNRIEVGSFVGKTITDYAQEIDATALVRGLRAQNDFNDEFAFQGTIRRFADISMVYLMCHHEYLHVSSSQVKEIASYGKPVKGLVAAPVIDALRLKFPAEYGIS